MNKSFKKFLQNRDKLDYLYYLLDTHLDIQKCNVEPLFYNSQVLICWYQCNTFYDFYVDIDTLIKRLEGTEFGDTKDLLESLAVKTVITREQ